MMFKLGAIPSPVDPRDYTMPSGAGSIDFPDEYSSLDGLNYTAKNQEQVNSCVSFALATAMEINAKNAQERRSNGFIYHNRELCEYKGEGMYVREALKSAQKMGVCLWNDYKENIEVPQGYEVFNEQKDALIPKAEQCKIGNYYYISIYGNPRFPNAPLGMLDITQTKKAIMQNGFVVVCFYVFNSIYNVTKDTPTLDYPDVSKAPLGSHAVIITGWQGDKWQIVNSWGDEWADKGIFYAPLDYPFHEAWTFDGIITEKPKDNKGWYKVGDVWHYDIGGADCKGWNLIGGKWYYFNKDGAMHTGWIYSKDKWYWLDSNGSMVSDAWRFIGGKWYYFNKNGEAVKGWAIINEKTYYFSECDFDGVKECQLVTTDENGAIK